MEHAQEFSSHNTLETCGSNVNRLVMKDEFKADLQTTSLPSKKIDKYSVLMIEINVSILNQKRTLLNNEHSNWLYTQNFQIKSDLVALKNGSQ